jgi:hypothetical protein
MRMRKLIAIPGFVLLAIGSVIVYFGVRIGHVMVGSGVGAGGFLIAIIGAFLILLSGIFEGVLKKRWEPSE